MGRRGPQKTSTEELKRRGSPIANFAERKNEIKAAKLAPNAAPPEWMSDKGRDIWVEHAPAAVSEGLLTNLDAAVFAMFCETIAEYIEARDDVAERGLTFAAVNGATQQNPAVKARDEARKAMLSIAKELGHTVISRIGLVVDKPDSKQAAGGPSLFAKG